MAIRTDKGGLVRTHDAEIVRIEPWGENGLRVRATCLSAIDESRDWALLPGMKRNADAEGSGDEGTITNGEITATIRNGGCITFSNARGEIVLQERWRSRMAGGTRYNATEVRGREFRPLAGSSYRVTARFESSDDERIYGMGQYQDGRLDLKGSTLELAHRNSQASVPFLLSSKGYGLLWNNPAVGRATFGMNVTEFVAEISPQLDYWVTIGETPSLIEERYAAVTGTVPMMPEFAMGFWQCKLRYKTQEELLGIAREYMRRGLPLSVIVCDFFHWPMQGEWKFDPRNWHDPEGMVKELRENGVELMVSVWPTVDTRSENFAEMRENGFLVRTERGVRTTMEFMGNTVFFDATHPGAREFVWNVAKRNYYEKGIRMFWLDEAEPEYSVYDYDHYRYRLGSVMEVGNIYPVAYAQAFYEGMRKEGQENIINLVRCAWAGSQRFGALVWSGDIDATWDSFRRQLSAGLNMGIAGIPWWTTDIGGFGGGDPDDPAYRELLIRWFQWGAFCPVFRLHGFRVSPSPEYAPLHPGGTSSEEVFSGGPNEVWSYGEEAYEILKKFLFLRERARPYIRELMKAAHVKGTPVMRPLFYDFSHDARAWDVADEYMFGPDVLVAPVMSPGARARSVYLPAGTEWKNAKSGLLTAGGETLQVEAPLDTIPVFIRRGVELPIEM